MVGIGLLRRSIFKARGVSISVTAIRASLTISMVQSKFVLSVHSKFLQIFPKAVRTRINKESLKGQLNIFIELSFFYDATTLFNTEKMEQCFIKKSGSNDNQQVDTYSSDYF